MNYDIFGWLAGLFGVMLSISQLKKLWQSRSVAGVSLAMWQLYVGVQIGWVFHGIVESNQPMTWASLACALMGLSVLVFFNKYKPKKTTRIAHAPSAWWIFGASAGLAGLFSWVAWYLPAEIKGLIFIFPTTFGQIHQLIKIHQAKSVAGLSVTMLLIYNFNQALLLIWSILIFDRTLTMTATTSMVILAGSIIRYYYKLRRFKKTLGC
jgi:hypothetical protein